jgi:type II secretory pathway pseudopilin PulG
MNAVALVAILSAIAMYGLSKYVRHSKTLEAEGTVESLAAAAAAYYDASDAEQPAGTTPDAAKAMRHFPPPSKTSVPADVASITGTKYQSALADWQGSPWRELRFTITQPQNYAYSFDSQGTGLNAFAVVTAHGDLDGDGNEPNGARSTFRLKVSPDATFHAKVAPAMEKIDPEE